MSLTRHQTKLSKMICRTKAISAKLMADAPVLPTERPVPAVVIVSCKHGGGGRMPRGVGRRHNKIA